MICGGGDDALLCSPFGWVGRACTGRFITLSMTIELTDLRVEMHSTSKNPLVVPDHQEYRPHLVSPHPEGLVLGRRNRNRPVNLS